MTAFGGKREGGQVNLEIDRGTQVIVDTIRDFLEERFGGGSVAVEGRATNLSGAIVDYTPLLLTECCWPADIETEYLAGSRKVKRLMQGVT